ncbi:hypothetical protein ZWY2020_013573 [Hordeum vulgare]|nr:hypothetical protein ZWY2020_013573 [Hordeum vulgare]
MSRKTAATPQMKATAMAPRVVTPTSKAVDPANRGSSKSPVESKTPDLGASLSARMGNMVRLDKEAEGMVFAVPEPRSTTKEYDGGTRPSKMVFDKVEMWVQVHDLPPDKRTEEFGNALGNWLGKVVRMDVVEEGKAKGQHLRVRAQISVFEPLVRGFFLRSSREEKSDSRTGEENRPGGKDVRSPINSRGIAKEQHERDLRYDLEQRREEVLRGKLVEQQRQRERVPTDYMDKRSGHGKHHVHAPCREDGDELQVQVQLGVARRSAVFTVGGYDWQIHFFPGGVIECCKDHVVAYVFLMSKNEEIKVRASFQLSLVDVTVSAPPRTMTTATQELKNTTNKRCVGLHKFMKRSELEGSPYLRNDRLTIECVADIAVVNDVKPIAKAPPSDIAEHLGRLLREKESTDVVLEVKGEDFPAHKIVLAMRSPVFKAELYGAMRAKNMSRIIISGMQPAVFEVLLHFIYNDSLPAMDDIGQDDYQETIRHLLVAADRYAMERLKITCEGILCDNIDVKTVVTTLALAAQHHCGRLSDACVRFIGSLSTTELDDVIASQGYIELKAICPLALVELWEMTCRIGRSKSSLQVDGSLASIACYLFY